MIHRLRPVLFVLFAILLVVPAPAQEHLAPLAKLELEDGDTLVFLGDSITHQCLYTQYVEDYFYTRFPGKRIKFHNAGVNGARAIDALDRFDRDVASYKPKYVTVLLGMNDGSYQPYKEEVFQTYHKDMTELIARIEKIGAAPILMTPTMFDSRAARLRKRASTPDKLELYNSVLAYYGTWLREVAVESGHGFVDMYSPLNHLTLQQRKANPNFTLITDSVHPDAPGQLVMAFAILEDMGAQRQVSNIRILAAGAKPRPQANGGKVSDLSVTADGLSFTWSANSLPWVVPEEAQSGAKLLRLGHRMSREALEVHGLPAGSYQLSIDGEVVGTYSSVQLSRHIELQENAKTPQHEQAARVAQLNKERNAGPVKSLRNEWSTFQRYSRAARKSAAAPDDAKFKAQALALKARLEGMEGRAAEHQRAAAEIEAKIFQTNQPKPRRYDLEKVK